MRQAAERLRPGGRVIFAERSGVPAGKAEALAWATVNKQDGGGKKSGSGRAKSKG